MATKGGLEPNQVLTTISRFSSPEQREKLRLLATAVVPSGLVEDSSKKIPEIYREIKRIHKGSSIPLFARLLRKAGVDYDRVSQLDIFVPATEANATTDEEYLSDLNFIELLVSVSDHLGNLEYLRLLANHIPEHKLGTLPENIKSAVQLFQILLHEGTLSLKCKEESLGLLSSWLGEIGRRDIVTGVIERYAQLHPLPKQEIANGHDSNSQLITMEDIEVLDTQLGCGSYGYVKVVKIRGTEYAGKFFYPREGLSEKVKKEVDILLKLQRLQHVNIVQYIGANTNNIEPVLIMELLRTNLQDHLKKKPDLSLLKMLRLLYDVSKGLEYLHQEHVIHRDLKAKNVLLDENDVAKIADFGNSRIVDFESSSDLATMTERPGNWFYCAPETKGYRPEYNNKVDIFSFDGNTPLKRRRLYMDRVEKKLKDHPELVVMIKDCLSEDRDKRPSASTLKIKLGELCNKIETTSYSKVETDSVTEDSAGIR